jgi:hypothetical protein
MVTLVDVKKFRCTFTIIFLMYYKKLWKTLNLINMKYLKTFLKKCNLYFCYLKEFLKDSKWFENDILMKNH